MSNRASEEVNDLAVRERVEVNLEKEVCVVLLAVHLDHLVDIIFGSEELVPVVAYNSLVKFEFN